MNLGPGRKKDKEKSTTKGRKKIKKGDTRAKDIVLFWLQRVKASTSEQREGVRICPLWWDSCKETPPMCQLLSTRDGSSIQALRHKTELQREAISLQM